MLKFLYIALIILLFLAIAFVGWKFRGKRNSHKVVNENKAWEVALNENRAYKEKQIVFFGDSQIALWPMQSSFGVLPIKNRGLSGDMATECINRFQEEVINLNPDLIAILIGTNDLNNNISVTNIINNIQKLIVEAQKTKAEIIICSLLPVNSKIANAGRPVSSILEINKLLFEICKKKGLEFVNFHEPLLDKDGFFNKQFSDDGLHPNKKGYFAMSGIILPYIINLLEDKNK